MKVTLTPREDDVSRMVNFVEGPQQHWPPAEPEGGPQFEEATEDIPLPEGMDFRTNRHADLKVCSDLQEWAKKVGTAFRNDASFEDLGLDLCDLLASLPSALGSFVREFCFKPSTRPPPGVLPPYDRKGDLLPIAPWLVSDKIPGVTDNNLCWVWALVVVHDFNYCTGWQKPICVPFADSLSSNQRDAITALAKVVDANVISGEKLGTLGEAKKLLASKKFDYSGKPVEYMEELVFEKVKPAWPKQGEAGVNSIMNYVSGETKRLLENPAELLLPFELMPEKSPRSKVRASDTEWYKLCAYAHKLGMMKVVDDNCIPRDRSGHLITNGAGAVKKEKVVGGKVQQCQRFISILVPTNAATTPIEGAQDTLPYIGTLCALMLEEDEMLYLDSEDLQSAFNLFSVPDQWLGYFAYSKKVDGQAFGLPAGKLVRPALSVVPMGWHSAVGVVQEAVRHLVFERAKVSRVTSVEKGKALPDSKSLSVVYLDNFDEITILKQVAEEFESTGEMTENHRRFNEVCDQDGLPRNLGKQLVKALSGGMQGGEFDGHRGILKVGSDKLRGFIKMSLGLLSSSKWSEFSLRHWTGKAAFCCAFRRVLFSQLGEIFQAIEESTKGDMVPPTAVVDEVLCFLISSIQAETELKIPLSEVISCTDASPTGGATAIATRFKKGEVKVPASQVLEETCAVCGTPFADVRGCGKYPCSRNCGARMCSVMCCFNHQEGGCCRGEMWTPLFGERFAGKNFPLTKACALTGVGIQPPLDKEIEGLPWEFFSQEGKQKLDDFENASELAVSHWAPECKTFSAARGRPITLSSGRRVAGPKALRSKENPWGLKSITKNEQIKVRQGNSMARRAITGCKDAFLCHRLASLEHPWNSHLWSTEEALELCETEGVFVTCYSHCCFGGRREKWQCLVHNCPELHEELHRPTCPGHVGLLEYSVREREDGSLAFDTEGEAEYPWQWCLAYAKGIKKALLKRCPWPVGLKDLTLENAIFSALKKATRGLQNDDIARVIAKQVYDMVSGMKPDSEADHLRWLIRHVSTRGCDIKIWSSKEDGTETFLTPYPGFMWLWKTVLSYKWKNEQHINVLEVSAFLVELRRRTRGPRSTGFKFINVTDSQVMFHVLTKGRSSSPRLNRLARRISALSLMGRVYAFHLWTISKWNFADHGSRRFQVISDA